MQFSLMPTPGINMLVGPNGSGKTSILEALSLIGFGRSFRGGGFASLISKSQPELSVFAKIKGERSTTRVGLGRSRGAGAWDLRIDGEAAKGLALVARHLPLAVFQPDDHELIQGGPEHRRRLADWTMFHVEPGLVTEWRRYQKALQQRNQLLRTGGVDRDFEVWEQLMGTSGRALAEWRTGFVQQFEARVVQLLAALSPKLSDSHLQFRPGWDGESLSDALAESRSDDRRVGFTRAGPHRFDFQLRDELGGLAKRLSRGQQKIVALAYTLAHAGTLRDHLNTAPVICLDDLGSELDSGHQASALRAVREMGAQSWITGVDPVQGLGDAKVFHVEQCMPLE